LCGALTQRILDQAKGTKVSRAYLYLDRKIKRTRFIIARGSRQALICRKLGRFDGARLAILISMTTIESTPVMAYPIKYFSINQRLKLSMSAFRSSVSICQSILDRLRDFNTFHISVNKIPSKRIRERLVENSPIEHGK